METLANFGAVQIAKPTYDTHDLQCFMGDEKTWPDWRYKLRLEASRSYGQAAAILSWADDRYDQPISESDIKPVAARDSWADMASLNMKFHGYLISLMEERAEDCATPRLKWNWMRGEG